MTRPGDARRRWWRWAVTTWAVVVAVGGALTLTLQEEARPKGPYGWESGDGSPPPPDVRGVRPRPYGGGCSPSPSAGHRGDAAGTPVQCVYVSTAR